MWATSNFYSLFLLLPSWRSYAPSQQDQGKALLNLLRLSTFFPGLLVVLLAFDNPSLFFRSVIHCNAVSEPYTPWIPCLLSFTPWISKSYPTSQCPFLHDIKSPLFNIFVSFFLYASPVFSFSVLLFPVSIRYPFGSQVHHDVLELTPPLLSSLRWISKNVCA